MTCEFANSLASEATAGIEPAMKVLQFSTTDARGCMGLHLLRKLGTGLHAAARLCGDVAINDIAGNPDALMLAHSNELALHQLISVLQEQVVRVRTDPGEGPDAELAD